LVLELREWVICGEGRKQRAYEEGVETRLRKWLSDPVALAGSELPSRTTHQKNTTEELSDVCHCFKIDFCQGINVNGSRPFDLTICRSPQHRKQSIL
jgi:hypothetical protein